VDPEGESCELGTEPPFTYGPNSPRFNPPCHQPLCTTDRCDLQPITSQIDSRKERKSLTSDAAVITEAIAESGNALRTCRAWFAQWCSGNDGGETATRGGKEGRRREGNEDGDEAEDFMVAGKKWAKWARAVGETPLFDRLMMMVVLVNCVSMIWNTTPVSQMNCTRPVLFTPVVRYCMYCEYEFIKTLCPPNAPPPPPISTRHVMFRRAGMCLTQCA